MSQRAAAPPFPFHPLIVAAMAARLTLTDLRSVTALLAAHEYGFDLAWSAMMVVAYAAFTFAAVANWRASRGR